MNVWTKRILILGAAQLLALGLLAQVKPGVATPYGSGSSTASGMAYTAPFTGAVATTANEWFGRVVDSRDALTAAEKADVKAGTMALDHTASFTKFWQNPDPGVILYVGPGNYKLTNTTRIVRSKSCAVVFAPGAFINGAPAAVAGQAVLEIAGSRGQYYAQTQPITLGEKTTVVNATLAATLAAGDLVMVTTDPSYGGGGKLWYGGQSVYYKGEMLEVESVSGTSITWKHPTRDAYTNTSTDVATLARINYVNVRLEGFRMAGDNAGTGGNVRAGLRISYAKNLDIVGGEVGNFSWGQVQLNYCYNASVIGMTAWEANSNVGYNYGLQILSCGIVKVNNCRLQAGRNGLDVGGWEPTRDVLVSNSYIATSGATERAIGTHGNCESFQGSNLTVDGGIMISGKRFLLSSSHVIARYPICVATDFTGTVQQGYTAGDGTFVILDGVTVESPDTYAGNNYFKIQVAGTIDLMRFRGVKAFGGAALTSPALFEFSSGLPSQSANGTISRLEFIDCDISTRNTAATNGVTFTNINIPHLRVRGHSSTLPDGVHFYALTGVTNKTAEFFGDLYSTATNSNTFKWETAGTEDLRWGMSYTNTYAGNGAYYQLKLVASRSIDLTGARLENLRSTSGFLATAPLIIARDIRKYNVASTDDLRGKVVHMVYANGTTEGAGTVVPTRGVYNVGDVQTNTNSVVGSAKGWRCTTAGGANSGTRANTTAYSLNDWKIWTTGTTVWEVTTAGTTTSAAPSITGKNPGDTVTDGTVVWTMRSATTAAFTSEGNL